VYLNTGTILNVLPFLSTTFFELAQGMFKADLPITPSEIVGGMTKSEMQRLCLRSSPTLRNLELHGSLSTFSKWLSPEILNVLLTTNWQFLRQLSFVGPFPSKHTERLIRALEENFFPNLRHLEITPWEAVPTTDFPFGSPKVSTLAINAGKQFSTFMETEAHHHVFQSFKKLKTLILFWKPFDRDPSRIFSVNEFLKRTSLPVTLTSLEIYTLLGDFDPSTSEFRSPTIEKLRAPHFILEGNGAQAIFTHFPKLRELRLHWETGTMTSEEEAASQTNIQRALGNSWQVTGGSIRRIFTGKTIREIILSKD
jgi:hypothetical protein